MSDAVTSPSAPLPAAQAEPAKPSSSAFCFTDPGCRTEVRLGALIILAAVFLWLFFGPTVCSRLYLIGAPLLFIGIPIQAIQARRDGRPGYPWKLGVVLTIGGGLMWPDLRYREVIGGPVYVQEIAPLLLAAGVWIMAWWPVARTRVQSVVTPEQKASA
ncbi:MAG: hypothetical protein H0W78_07585 [Planctomycetes bacterium]|jgi:hypothetical protein|nr:hypothetical protein [Planctomycetota bacterium]